MDFMGTLASHEGLIRLSFPFPNSTRFEIFEESKHDSVGGMIRFDSHGEMVEFSNGHCHGKARW